MRATNGQEGTTKGGGKNHERHEKHEKYKEGK